jgi:hypothetical protein
LPKVISDEDNVSATLSISKNGLSEGGSNRRDGNDEPSIISPTPVITIFLCKKVVSGGADGSGVRRIEGYEVLK